MIFVQSGLRRLLVLCVAVLAAGLAAPAVQAQDGDTIEGAIWRFTMTSKARKGEKRGGRFRVADHVLYQKDKPAPDSEEHVVGKNHPNGRKTLIEFTDLRTFGDNRRDIRKVSGKLRLSMDKRGEWSGELTAGDGVHWNFRCVRIVE